MTGPPVGAFWCRSPSRPNFGDGLTPWLIRRLTGHAPRYVAASSPHHKYVVTGSVLGLVSKPATVWGAGVMTRGERVAGDVELLAVRGPLTREAALLSGVDCPGVFGDPALLLPQLLPVEGRRSGVVLVPHFSDAARMASRWRHPEVRLVDPQRPVEDVVRRIAAAELVLSSSLHGLVVAHAYGVPAVWVEFASLPSGDRTKFYDHLLAVGLEPRPPIRADPTDLDLAGLSRWQVRAPVFDTEPLWQMCPFAVVDTAREVWA